MGYISFTLLVFLTSICNIHSSKVQERCSFGIVEANVTILGGLAAGRYKYVESAKDVFACGLMCCRERSVDYAFLLDTNCFCLTCLHMSLCKTVRITPPEGRNPSAIKLKRTANREIINKLIEEHRALHNISLITGTASAFTGPKLVRRTALAIGNKEIRLYCSGAIQIEGVEAFGVSGKLETIKRFNAYCKSHIKFQKNMNQCDVSLARVYGTNFPQVDSVTKVTYLCREKKR